MKFDKTKLILDTKGQPIIERNRDGSLADPADPTMNFGKLVILALTSDAADPDTQQPFKPAVKYKHFRLAESIEKSDRYFEVGADEKAMIRKLVGIFPPTYVARCWEIIDAPEPAVKKPAREKAA